MAEKLFYKIGEVAEMLNVSTSQIRFWENEFEILKPERNKKGNRLFTKKDLDNLIIIHHLVKERGFTLQGAREKLKENPSDLMNKAELVKSLKKIYQTLEEIRDEIDRLPER